MPPEAVEVTSSKQNKQSVTFTPINPLDLITLDRLLPAKSTWITPRL